MAIGKKMFMISLFILILVFPMAICKNSPYDLVIKAKFSDKDLNDANVTINGITKKTNLYGKAKFKNIDDGNYEVAVEREGYDSVSKNIDVDGPSNFTIELKRDDVDNKQNSAKLKILNVENDSIVNVNPLSVRFSVDSDVAVSYCRLLIQKSGLSGYRAYEKLDDISLSNKHELTGEISNGRHIVKIMCEGSSGIFYSPKYYLHGEGISNKKVDSSSKKQVSGQDKVTDAGSSIDKEFSDFIKKAKNAKKNIKNSGLKETARIFGLIDKINENIKDVEALKIKRRNLENLEVSQSDYNSKKREISKKFNSIKKSTPLSIEIIKNKKIIDPVTKQETEAAVEKYLAVNGKDEAGIGTLTEASRDVQQDISTYGVFRHALVNYAANNSKVFSIIQKENKINKNLSKGFFVESIPEEFASSVEKINFLSHYELFNESFVKFEPMAKITYYVRGKVDFSVMTKAKTVFVLPEGNSGNMLTGFSFAGGLEKAKGSFIVIFLAIIGLVGSTLVVKNVDYGKVKNSFPSLSFGARNIDNNNNFVDLLNNALGYLKENRGAEAVELYPKIIRGFDNLGEKSKNELQPMVSYLSSMVDIQYINKLIDKACRDMAEGQFNTCGDLCKEIEGCYSELPNYFAYRLKDKYEFYKYLLSLKNQRQNEKVRQVYERFYNGHVKEGQVDDRIFGLETM
ncbi:MAG: hypothetical protein ACQESF_01440 [Nanobdellota archaeon]